LNRALREVGAATSAMLVADDVRGRLLFAARQAFDVQTLLEDAGAVVDVDLAIGDGWSPQARLRAAAEALAGRGGAHGVYLGASHPLAKT